MTHSKIIFRGKDLETPIGKFLLCSGDLSKSTLCSQWFLGSRKIHTDSFDYGPFNFRKDLPILEAYSDLLEKIRSSASPVVTVYFSSEKAPPFDLLNNIKSTNPSLIDTIELYYHSYKSQYGCHIISPSGVSSSSLSRSSDGNSKEPSMETSKVDRMGMPIDPSLDLGASATFIENIPEGKYLDFLREHDFPE